MLAKRFQIHTILACYQSGQANISQNMLINESMVIAKRRKGERPPMRIISLDRFPTDENRAIAKSSAWRPGGIQAAIWSFGFSASIPSLNCIPSTTFPSFLNPLRRRQRRSAHSPSSDTACTASAGGSNIPSSAWRGAGPSRTSTRSGWRCGCSVSARRENRRRPAARRGPPAASQPPSDIFRHKHRQTP